MASELRDLGNEPVAWLRTSTAHPRARHCGPFHELSNTRFSQGQRHFSCGRETRPTDLEHNVQGASSANIAPVTTKSFMTKS